jgi:hydroxymethylglutaryl-CoA synthase
MDQVKQGLMVPYIGNTYSGASMIGLASVLDVAKPGDRIFMTSYGSGAGSDGFDMTVTNNITRLARQKAPTIAQLVADKEYVDYGTYAKMTNLLFWE